MGKKKGGKKNLAGYAAFANVPAPTAASKEFLKGMSDRELRKVEYEKNHTKEKLKKAHIELEQIYKNEHDEHRRKHYYFYQIIEKCKLNHKIEFGLVDIITKLNSSPGELFYINPEMTTIWCNSHSSSVIRVDKPTFVVMSEKMMNNFSVNTNMEIPVTMLEYITTRLLTKLPEFPTRDAAIRADDYNSLCRSILCNIVREFNI